MQFRDLKTQYQRLKPEIDAAIQEVLDDCNFISGKQVMELEQQLASYVGVKHCVSCANGTDALSLAVMALEIGQGDAVFVPDFTFFSSGEIVSLAGATPIFVDVRKDTYNIDPMSLRKQIDAVLKEGKLVPKAIIAVDLFGLPAEYDTICDIAKQYRLKVIEDAAQGFGGALHSRMACSFGDIATTSFFPAKPLGCYGDGGAVFTDNDGLANILKSLRIHGKGDSKYDNIRVGMNSRLDTLQAAILAVKLNAFQGYELTDINIVADQYTAQLADIVTTPVIPDGYRSSWAQYTIQLPNRYIRDQLQAELKALDIPSMIYYQKPMHRQDAFSEIIYNDTNYENTIELCDTVLSLPMHPYLSEADITTIVDVIKTVCKK